MSNLKKSFYSSLFLSLILFTNISHGASSERINEASDEMIEVFKNNVDDAEIFLSQAAGYLIFPRITKLGALFGIETGEGVLRVNNQTIEYYRTLAGSFGFQFGMQAKAILIVFLSCFMIDFISMLLGSTSTISISIS